MWLGNVKLLNAKRVKVMMHMLFALKIGMDPTTRLLLGFATPPLLLFTRNLGDTILLKKFGVCLLLGILDLMVQESITLWSPYINCDKNLANISLHFIVACIFSMINWLYLNLSSRLHLRLKLLMHIMKWYNYINLWWEYIMSFNLCVASYCISLRCLRLIKRSMSWVVKMFTYYLLTLPTFLCPRFLLS